MSNPAVILVPPASKTNADFLADKHAREIKRLGVKLKNAKGFDAKEVIKMTLAVESVKFNYYKNFYKN